MEFEQEIHARTGCSLLRASEELIETLEENQVFKYRMVSIICDYFHQGNEI
jgi:dynein heavy chain